MGSNQGSQWKPSSHLYTVKDHQYCKVWVGKGDQIQLMEEYQIHISNDEQLQMYQNMFTNRIQQPFFPNTLYFFNHQSKYLCGGSKIGSIFIQRIPYRLCQFNGISYNLAISVLYHSLNAYHQLFKSYGLFNIRTSMIGFDRNFEVKVWHNSNFSSLIPQNPHCQSIVEMINSIVNNIENISDSSNCQLTFSSYISHKKMVLFRFELAKVMIKQYLYEYGIDLIDRFQDIVYYLTHPQSTLKKQNSVQHQQKQIHSIINQSKYQFRNKRLFNSIEFPQSKEDQFYHMNTSKHYSNLQTDAATDKEYQ